MTAGGAAMHRTVSRAPPASMYYDRSRTSGPQRLPTPPLAVRSRSDAMRDFDRLAAAFKGLLSASPPQAAQRDAPSTARHEFEAIDEAIAAANALSETLCEWRGAMSSGSAEQQ